MEPQRHRNLAATSTPTFRTVGSHVNYLGTRNTSEIPLSPRNLINLMTDTRASRLNADQFMGMERENIPLRTINYIPHNISNALNSESSIVPNDVAIRRNTTRDTVVPVRYAICNICRKGIQFILRFMTIVREHIRMMELFNFILMNIVKFVTQRRMKEEYLICIFHVIQQTETMKEPFNFM